jgi:uncharacterized repeat protein (TIGR01451 family)
LVGTFIALIVFNNVLLRAPAKALGANHSSNNSSQGGIIYQNLEFPSVDEIAFKVSQSSNNCLDDIQVAREDYVYQSFEPSKWGGIVDPNFYGWAWPPATVALSEEGEPVYEGDHSWKLHMDQYWLGTGIHSEQSTTNVDLNPEFNDHLILWVYALPENGLDNGLIIHFCDHDTYSPPSCAHYWTDKTPTVSGKWSRLSVPFADLITRHPGLNLNQIQQIEVQAYWPSTYYIDKIEAVGAMPEWDKHRLSDGVIQWRTRRPLDQYRLQENTVTGDLKDGNWVDVYTGTTTAYTIPHISRVWYRVRAEDVVTAAKGPFVSTWSDPLEYNPAAVLIDKSTLMLSQTLTWTQLAHATVYTVESGSSPNGPWTPFYTGAYPAASLPVAVNTWFRVRAGTGTEESDWSPPQWKPDPIEQDILRTYGTSIRKGPADEVGNVVVLRGVNLGNYLLIEPWLNGWGPGNITSTATVTETDYYTIRKVLEIRFGADGRDALLQTYRDSYLTDADFDILMRMGVNLVRLPIYYEELQDDGNLIPGTFEKLDRVVEACADRGIYVLLDLHGAPGAQSKECHTGRCWYNRLFQGDEQERAKFQARTIALWQEIANHYKDNTTVMGYDLLNEPNAIISNDVQGPNKAERERLWAFYDQLYDAIRDTVSDTHHIIVMEGNWDWWPTLPDPAKYGWENVVYQIHHYHPLDENSRPPKVTYQDFVQSHKDFIDDKIDMVTRYQNVYQVPVMIGEFHAYDSREAWEYYLAKYNEQDWSWTLWTYKMAIPNATWGLLTDHDYDIETLPRFRDDTYTDLQNKLSEQFDTLARYVPNVSLVGIVERYANAPYTVPATNRFQTEFYDGASGVNTGICTTTGLVTRTSHIGWLDAGDWVRYGTVEFTEELNAFVASLAVDNTNAGKQIVIRLDDPETGPIIGTLIVAGTGGWCNFTKQQAPISPVAGVHDVYLTFTGGSGAANIDWFTFDTRPAFEVSKHASHTFVQPGARLTYTIRVTNTRNVPLAATITDILPPAVTLDATSGETFTLPDGREGITWITVNIGPGQGWTETVVVTLDDDYQGLRSNLVEVAAEGWPTGKACAASCAGISTVAIRTYYDKYITAMNDEEDRDWQLRGGADYIRAWEKFTFICLKDGQIALLTAHQGKYVSARPQSQDWVLRAETTELQDWEKFTPICVDDGKVALKTYHGRYVSAMRREHHDNWVLRAETTELQDWEKFTLIPLLKVVYLPIISKSVGG